MRIDAVQSTPAVNQSHASKNISILIMDSSFSNQNLPPTCRIYHSKMDHSSITSSSLRHKRSRHNA